MVKQDGVKQGQMGSKGDRWGQTGLNRVKQGLTYLNWDKLGKAGL